jgi:hypothetical protein
MATANSLATAVIEIIGPPIPALRGAESADNISRIAAALRAVLAPAGIKALRRELGSRQ